VAEKTPARSDHERRNEVYWNEWAHWYAEAGHHAWAADEPYWGIWRIPEAQVGSLAPLGDLNGKDVIELGCGTAYCSAWFARRGARPVGIDLSESQLATARELQAKHGLEFPLIHGTAESVPLPDASFDVAFSEYGAALWAEPRAWLSEAARLLRPGGWLVFVTSSPLAILCATENPDGTSETLQRPQFEGLGRMEWESEDSVEFHLAHGDMIALLRELGFAIEALHELRPPADAKTRYDFMPLEWARQWPCEEIWVARREGG
jgi:SAM-dependent methyltransferase